MEITADDATAIVGELESSLAQSGLIALHSETLERLGAYEQYESLDLEPAKFVQQYLSVLIALINGRSAAQVEAAVGHLNRHIEGEIEGVDVELTATPFSTDRIPVVPLQEAVPNLQGLATDLVHLLEELALSVEPLPDSDTDIDDHNPPK